MPESCHDNTGWPWALESNLPERPKRSKDPGEELGMPDLDLDFDWKDESQETPQPERLGDKVPLICPSLLA